MLGIITTNKLEGFSLLRAHINIHSYETVKKIDIAAMANNTLRLG